MNINAYDLVIFHKNVDRVVGKEIFPNNTLANNDMDIMRSIEKLIKAGLLIKTNEFDISIYKKTLTELKEIVTENNLKKSGTKTVLINRIKENINLITNLDLPFVYKATYKGENTLIDTKYLLSFDMGWDSDFDTTIHRAFYLANNYIPKDCEDKVAEIYKLEFKSVYDNKTKTFKTNQDKRSLDIRKLVILQSLVQHYEYIEDYDNTRKYMNLIYYFNIKEIVDDLQKTSSAYYQSDGSLDLERLKDKLRTYHSSIYAKMKFTENLSNDNIFKLFKDDVKEFNELDDILTEIYIYYIISMITRADETNDFLKLVDVLKEGYVLDEKEFEYDWDYSSHFITTDLATLKDLKSNILVQVDKRSGKIDFLLDNDSLAKLNSLENED